MTVKRAVNAVCEKEKSRKYRVSCKRAVFVKTSHTVPGFKKRQEGKLNEDNLIF